MLPLPQYPSRNSLSGISQSGRKDPSSAYRLYGFDRFHEFPATGRFCPRQYFPANFPSPGERTDCFQKFLYKQSHHAWKLQITAAINTTTLKTSGSLSAVDFNYRIGYEVGFLCSSEKTLGGEPGLYFTSKGGKNQEVTLRQNYLELPVKFTWLYQDRQNGWWKGLSVSPYGAVRIGEKLKNNTGYGNDLFKTSPLGLRFTVCHQHASHFF